MNSTRYVLRAHYFGYNDECFYISGSHIHQVFDDQTLAMQAWKDLEVQAAREYPLNELQSFFEGDKAFLQEMDDFVFSRCGQHILDEHGWPIDDTLPTSLNDEDTFELINKAKINSYQLLTLQPDERFYTIWLPASQQYLMQHDECISCLVYAVSTEALTPHLEVILDDNPYVLTGSLDQLSDSPALLEAAIKSHKRLKYNNKKQQLEIHDYDYQALQVVNGLLKNPVFEYKTHTLDEIVELEKTLVEDHYWDEEDE